MAFIGRPDIKKWTAKIGTAIDHSARGTPTPKNNNNAAAAIPPPVKNNHDTDDHTAQPDALDWASPFCDDPRRPYQDKRQVQ